MSLNGYTGLEMIEMFNDAEALIDRPSNIVFSKEWFDTGKLNTQPTQQTSEVKPDKRIFGVIEPIYFEKEIYR